MMTYKGYRGITRVDDDAGVIRGKVVNTQDTVTFQGETVAQARAAFRESVDDYLAFCGSLGQPPEKPFSGEFLVRVPPRVHRDVTALAASKGVSVNRFVGHHLRCLAAKAAAAGKAATAATPPPGKGAGAAGRKAKAAKRKAPAG